MAPCSAEGMGLNPVISPGIPIPGFGISTSPIQIGLPSFDLPSDLLEDFAGLIEKLKALFPSGTFKVNPEFQMKSVFDFLSSVLSQIAPFLSLYNFFMALLNMINCIIEVLCAIPNPFAVASKLKKLFAECLPPFLNLFPFLALIAMIIALLLLILALIDYIINTILAIIDMILKNLELFAKGVTLSDAQSTLAAVNKLASLFCFVQNILSILIALAAILAIIQALAGIGGSLLCDDSDPDGCCIPEFCPPFIKENFVDISLSTATSGPVSTTAGIPPHSLLVTAGRMTYVSQVGADVATILGIDPALAALLNIGPIRKERWQIYDTETATYPILSIITKIGDNIFWPDGTSFDSSVSLKKAPYLVDVRVKLDPNTFGIVDGYGERYFKITDCAVIEKPYLGVYAYDNSVDFLTNFTGTLSIAGGLVYEDDGYTVYNVGGVQATLGTFIYIENPETSTELPQNTVDFDDVEFIWHANTGALAGYQLITVGCMPEVSLEKATQNAELTANGINAVVDKLAQTPNGQLVPSTGVLPNVTGAQECVTTALAKFRLDVSTSGAAEFQSTFQTCLGDLRDQTIAALKSAIGIATSQFKSEFSLDTDAQFTTRVITVTVLLKDANGVNIATSIPSDVASEMADKLEAEITLGTITDFTYDGVSSFKAEISSKVAGAGTIGMLFDNKVFNTKTTGTVDSISVIDENILSYEFIDATVDGIVRRDVGDVE